MKNNYVKEIFKKTYLGLKVFIGLFIFSIYFMIFPGTKDYAIGFSILIIYFFAMYIYFKKINKRK